VDHGKFRTRQEITPMRIRTLLIPILTFASLTLLSAGEPEKQQNAAEWDRVVDRAIAYLRSTQAEDGSWSAKSSPGVTGITLTGMLQTGKITAKDPTAEKALKYIESLINPENGHIAGKGAHVKLQNYVTCVNVMALVAANRDTYKKTIGDATKFLKQLQWDEGEGKTKESDFYGGAGYDSQSRPDLSNTQFFIDALVAAGIPKNDPALAKALIFVNRCQNLKDEGNDQPWAGKKNDGTFVYSAAGGGSTKVQDKPDDDGGLPGYGSMTYAGVKSMIYCGVSKDDKRIKKAMEWIEKHYTLEKNPGMPGIRAEWGLYYYYHTMAKCLDVMGVDRIKDGKGQEHDWRAEMTAALAKLQAKDGSFHNTRDKWMEGDPNMVTGYALMALSHCKPKK
jgi:squalene-hopene/tetraprenyl-beta-curcumene cyclase